MLTPLAWLAPTVPTLLVDAHRGHRTEMLAALADAADALRSAQPRAMIVVSARWQSSGPFLADSGRRHETLTEYTDFGVEVRYDCAGEPQLARALVERGRAASLRVATATRGVDSGVTVPLHFLVPGRKLPVVPLSVADRTPGECRAWGASIRAAADAWPEPVAFVVGGLISFNPHAWRLGRAIAGEQDYDAGVIAALASGDWAAIEAAARPPAEDIQVQSGLRHLEILRGFLGPGARGKLCCYESGPGVGAALMEFALEGAVPNGGPAPAEPGAARPDQG